MSDNRQQGLADFTKADWERIIEKFPEANFTQSPAYGKMHELLGERVVAVDFAGQGHALMIVRDAKRGRYLEIPCGPLINWSDHGLAREAIDKVSEVARQERCVFARLRPQLMANDENLKLLTGLGLKESPMHLAAEHTVMLDLRLSEDELLTGMRRQTRYEVRRAEKLGIEVTKDDSEELFKEFHQIQLETAQRQSFIPPNIATLMAEREAFGGQIWIYVARVGADMPDGGPKKGAAIAYGLIIADGHEADYFEAASTELNRKLPGAYALLWRAMRDLKAAGYERFNLWGIAPAGQTNHRYAGVTTFKTGFGGEVIEYVPAHDLVISRIGYLKDLIVEKARKKRRHL